MHQRRCRRRRRRASDCGARRSSKCVSASSGRPRVEQNRAHPHSALTFGDRIARALLERAAAPRAGVRPPQRHAAGFVRAPELRIERHRAIGMSERLCVILRVQVCRREPEVAFEVVRIAGQRLFEQRDRRRRPARGDVAEAQLMHQRRGRPAARDCNRSSSGNRGGEFAVQDLRGRLFQVLREADAILRQLGRSTDRGQIGSPAAPTASAYSASSRARVAGTRCPAAAARSDRLDAATGNARATSTACAGFSLCAARRGPGRSSRRDWRDRASWPSRTRRRRRQRLRRLRAATARAANEPGAYQASRAIDAVDGRRARLRAARPGRARSAPADTTHCAIRIGRASSLARRRVCASRRRPLASQAMPSVEPLGRRHAGFAAIARVVAPRRRRAAAALGRDAVEPNRASHERLGGTRHVRAGRGSDGARKARRPGRQRCASSRP